MQRKNFKQQMEQRHHVMFTVSRVSTFVENGRRGYKYLPVSQFGLLNLTIPQANKIARQFNLTDDYVCVTNLLDDEKE